MQVSQPNKRAVISLHQRITALFTCNTNQPRFYLSKRASPLLYNQAPSSISANDVITARNDTSAIPPLAVRDILPHYRRQPHSHGRPLEHSRKTGAVKGKHFLEEYPRGHSPIKPKLFPILQL